LNLDHTLVEIRERPFLELLDLSLVVARGRPLPLLAAAMAGTVPFVILNALILPSEGPAVFGSLLLAYWMEAPLATAPLTLVLGALMFDERPTARGVLRKLVRGLGPLLVFQGLVRTICLPVYPLVLGRFGFVGEVILLERPRWWRAAGRSARLSRGRGGELIGQWHLQVAFGAAFVACAFFGSRALFGLMIDSDPTWEAPVEADLGSWRLTLAAWWAIWFFAVARFLVYIDQRVRTEGWEVMRRLRSAALALEERQRWDH
jgi:hypothetical protein